MRDFRVAAVGWSGAVGGLRQRVQADDCCEGEKMTDYQSKLAKELHELRKDAERCRWLAERMLAADFDYGGDGTLALVFEMPEGFRASADFRDTIDSAMRTEQFPGVDIDAAHRKD